jgi:hypothetical protein
VKQQQQQQQQDEDDAEDTEHPGVLLENHSQGKPSKRSKARSKQRARKQQALEAAQQAGLQPLSAGQLAALYADPGARYYAAGFAARQTAVLGTGLRACAALLTPHMIACRVVYDALQYARLPVLFSECDWNDSGEASRDMNELDLVVAKTLEVGRAAIMHLALPCLVCCQA